MHGRNLSYWRMVYEYERRAIIAHTFWAGLGGNQSLHNISEHWGICGFADLNLNYLLYVQLRFWLRLATRFYE